MLSVDSITCKVHQSIGSLSVAVSRTGLVIDLKVKNRNRGSQKINVLHAPGSGGEFKRKR